MILYPAGWGAERVQRICGPEADAFYLAECTLGSRNFNARTQRIESISRFIPFCIFYTRYL